MIGQVGAARRRRGQNLIIPANTRVALAEEDAKFRKRQSRMTRIRLFPVDRYQQAYRKQSLDPFAQTDLFRTRNAGTPTSPPLYD